MMHDGGGFPRLRHVLMEGRNHPPGARIPERELCAFLCDKIAHPVARGRSRSSLPKGLSCCCPIAGSRAGEAHPKMDVKELFEVCRRRWEAAAGELACPPHFLTSNCGEIAELADETWSNIIVRAI